MRSCAWFSRRVDHHERFRACVRACVRASHRLACFPTDVRARVPRLLIRLVRVQRVRCPSVRVQRAMFGARVALIYVDFVAVVRVQR